VSEDCLKKPVKITLNDNLLMDNMHVRLCALESKFDKMSDKLDKALKSRWISLVETIILAIALIVTAIVSL